MKLMSFKGVVGLFLLGITVAAASVTFAGNSPLDAFPPAQENEVRHVIVLDDKGQEQEVNYQVELIPGKVVKTDGVNRARLGLNLTPVNLEGWGYTYYRVVGKDHIISTMMAVPPGSEPSESFVAGSSLLLRYNSRLPIVIYSPKGVDIRYRLWTAGEVQDVTKDE